MRYGLTIVVAVALCGAGRLVAREPPATGAASRETLTTPPAPGAAPAADAAGKAGQAPATTQPSAATPPVDCPPFHGWVRAEYLFWWMRGAPLPVPIVTTGDPRVGFDPNNVNTVNTAGAIGQPGTRVLVGDRPAGFAPFSGGRLGFGVWCDDDATFAVAGSGFFFDRLTQNFSAKSDALGNGPLYFPIFSAIAGAERAVPIADPLRQFSGGVETHASLRLWGAEGNGVVPLVRSPGVEWDLLAGSRYADLLEKFAVANSTTDLIFNNTTALSELFETRNQFYGGQLGGRLAVNVDRFFVDATAEVALGVTHQVVGAAGTITQLGPNPLVPPGPGTFPGGIFTQRSNIGRRAADPFSALSSLEVKLGYDLTPRARIFAGYDVLYWTQVVRPGNQISHAVNLSQNAVLDPAGAGVLVGPAQPALLFNRSSFWAQGITFGLSVSF
ncbi:MAG TPA: BBP7 family outer membrane beta-barrel protein [Gemmataceae bacterium]|jgi:hypothetical protein